eukprot:3299946-Rhodomonas_salina.2
MLPFMAAIPPYTAAIPPCLAAIPAFMAAVGDACGGEQPNLKRAWEASHRSTKVRPRLYVDMLDGR